MINTIQKIDTTIANEITAFLKTLPAESQASGEHDIRWLNVLQKGLSQKPYIIICRDDETNSINGYLPLAYVKSFLFGKFLVSLPYINRAGVLATTDEIALQLIDQAVSLADKLNVKYLELRHQSKEYQHKAFTYKRDEKVRMVLELPESPEALSKDIGPKVRNLVKKGEKHNLTIRFGRHELLNDFYDVFAVNMRDLGTPVYSKKLFKNILEEFTETAELVVVNLEDKAVAVALLIHDDNIESLTQVPSASALREYNKTSANMWMYHQMLLHAMERGVKYFDFGRSSVGCGTYKFKKQWGAKPNDTIWQYYLREGDTQSMRPDNPKNKKRIETWQKLPVWLTRLFGPAIVRGIP